MSENIIPIKTPYHMVMLDLKSRPRIFTLSWERGGRIHTVTTSCREQILRQLKSLADRRMAATVFADGQALAMSGPAPSGSYKIIMVGDALTD